MRDIDKVMSALSSPVRREILALIWDREMPAGQIATAFAVTKPTVSQHLAVLKEAGLVSMSRAGTSRRYRANHGALTGLHGALDSSFKWTPAEEIPERALAHAFTKPVVVAGVDVETDQQTTFTALTDPVMFSRWLGAPVTMEDGRFAATMEFGTEVRGTYQIVAPPELIVLRWDFEDDNVPVPGGEFLGYVWVTPRSGGGAHVEVHQLIDLPRQAEFMEAAWGTVLGRLKSGVAASSAPGARAAPRRRRPKRRSSA